jgi:hypothetical protein
MRDRIAAAASRALLGVFLVWTPGAALAGQSSAVLYRIFLHDGTTLVSYGEYARVADRVVFSMPLGAPQQEPSRLQLVSIPEASIDWSATDRYAESARAAHYVATRGDIEFGQMNTAVAQALNDLALEPDPRRKVEKAEEARRNLAAWSARTYGYRAAEVGDLALLLDQAVAELRAAAGGRRFDLSFVAGAPPPSTVPLMPPPTLRESIEQTLAAARLTPEPTERMDLLSAIIRDLDRLSADESWAVDLRQRALQDLALETTTQEAYAKVTAKAIDGADRYVRDADVQAIETLVRRVLADDDRLGRRRPHVVSALLAALDERLEAARRLRVARDHWLARLPAFKAYRRAIDRVLGDFRHVAPALERLRSLSESGPGDLADLERRISRASDRAGSVIPPPELDPAHALLRSALQLAAGAGRARAAVAAPGGDLTRTMEASSAAAGALMLFGRASGEIARLLEPPRLR